jgi:hypothetical protein
MKKLKALITAPLLIALLFPAPTAVAADCTKACLDVSVKMGRSLFLAKKAMALRAPKLLRRLWLLKKLHRKNQHQKSHIKATQCRIATRKPVVKKPVVVKKKVVAKKATAATSIADRLTKLLPTGGVAYQPAFEPLVHVPVVFWCDLPKIFSYPI